MSLLHGQFSIVVVLDAPDVSSGMAIEEALAPLLEEFGLQIVIRPIPDGDDDADLGNLVAISVDGADHPGTIARIARVIADAGGSIVDLVGHVVLAGGEEPSHLELTAALAHEAVGGLRIALEKLAGDLRMRCEIREVDARPI
jgi:glycine cleavage system transcriptional repressor